MEILVIDLEATCWRTKPPKGQHQEIIEIGCMLVDTKRNNSYCNRTYLCRPVTSQVSEFCTELTSITPEMVAGAPSVREQIEEIKKVYGNLSRKCWASWGDFDRKLFFKQSLFGGFEYPFGDRHINIKTMFSVLTGVEDIPVSEALNYFKLPFEGTQHRAGDDAFNIAKIFCELLTVYRKKS